LWLPGVLLLLLLLPLPLGRQCLSMVSFLAPHLEWLCNPSQRACSTSSAEAQTTFFSSRSSQHCNRMGILE